jgi:acetylornithine deacetylase/succinyl-diaminopimelate desuccinylase-like protein
MIDRVLGDIDTDLDNSLSRLFDWLKIQSISTDPAYKSECRRAAEWVQGELEALGFKAHLGETSLHPVVVGTSRSPARRTCSSTAIMTCSPSIRWSSGRPRPSSRRSPSLSPAER